MADNIKQETANKLIIITLKCVAKFAKAAGAVNPIFSVAGTALQTVLDHVDDDNLMKNLKSEFEKIKKTLDDTSQKNQKILKDISKGAVDSQYAEIEKNLYNQFISYMKMMNAQPEDLEEEIKNFKKNYLDNKDDQNMNNLYDGVVKTKLFSQPIIKVYEEHSKGDTQVMKDLCQRLNYLFATGYITMMAYYALKRDDMENREKKWEQNMMNVERLISKWM